MKWFLNLKLSNKLILLSMVMSLITFLVGFSGITNIGKINNLEEMASTSEELTSQAEQLNDIISFFKFDNVVIKKKHLILNHAP